MEREPFEYRRGLVVVNPTKVGSDSYNTAMGQVGHLAERIGFPIKIVHTAMDSYARQTDIAFAAEPTDLMIVLGGDGTVNSAVNAIFQLPPNARPDLIAGAVGSSSDFVRSLYGHMRGPEAMSDLVLFGKPADVQPMRLSVKDVMHKMPNRHLAVNNIGFNYTAKFADLMNQPAHRNGRLRRIPVAGMALQYVATGLRSMDDLATFDMIDPETGDRQAALDRMMVHARRAARIGRFTVSHTDGVFLDIVSERNSKTAVMAGLVRMMTGTLPNERVQSVSFKTGDKDILGHTDGEKIPIPPRSKITVDLIDSSFRTYMLAA